MKRILSFALVGGFATILDWFIFYILAINFNMYYQFALVVSFSLSAVFNYVFNKKITFKSRSKKIFSQFTLFFIIALFALLISILVMFVLVDLFLIDKLISRIFTTLLIFFINYLAHSNLTFSNRFFC